MLKIVNFSKQYGSKIAVSNLNLLVQKVPSRFMRKIVCRLRLSEVSRQ